MGSQALAIKYRPQDWSSVIGQESVKVILSQQIESGQIQHAYLFCGGAGTGKTTCARIFANEINKGQGNPIELDAASNNGVDDVRGIIAQAQTKSLDSEYKVFIIDECHAISAAGWQAFLKLIEEPPAGSIFIFATTDPQKIPKTILSRVQRYDFQRISQDGIVQRLKYILDAEGIIRLANTAITDDLKSYAKNNALEYIAKIADGGMRDAITLLDKCLAYSTELTLENVIKALGTVDYDSMFKLTDFVLESHLREAINVIEGIYASGKDIKAFLKHYTHFLLDIQKYNCGCYWSELTLPHLPEYEKWIKSCGDYEFGRCFDLLDMCVRLNSEIKYSNTPKADIEAELVLTFMERE